MEFDDQGYEWCEVTNLQQQANGQRVFIKGRPLDRTAELADGIREIAARLARPEYQDQGIDPDGLKVLTDDLRNLL